MAKSPKQSPEASPVEKAPKEENVEPVVEAAPVPVVVPAVPADVVVHDKFEVLNQKVADLASSLRELQVHLKAVQKDLVKVVKTSSKRVKSHNTGAKKSPSGFAKPTKLADNLCEFLEVEKGTEMARTEVTRRINAYIKEHNLQDAKDKRKIFPDAKLKKVLNMKDGDTLTFFNLQSHLKESFLRA